MAIKQAKTAQKSGDSDKPTCPDCKADLKVVKFAGYGDTGLFWVCEKDCGYKKRTR